MADKKIIGGNGPLIMPPTGGRCVHCSNPQPCFAHTEIRLTQKDGQVITYPNMPTLLAAVITALAQMNERIDRLAAPRVSVQ